MGTLHPFFLHGPMDQVHFCQTSMLQAKLCKTKAGDYFGISGFSPESEIFCGTSQKSLSKSTLFALRLCLEAKHVRTLPIVEKIGDRD